MRYPQIERVLTMTVLQLDQTSGEKVEIRKNLMTATRKLKKKKSGKKVKIMPKQCATKSNP